MSKNCMAGLFFGLVAGAFLCGCNRTTPISGVWRSNVADHDTLRFHDDGLWQIDTVVRAKGMSYPVVYGGHYSIIDTNHVSLSIETSNGSLIYTNEFYLKGRSLFLQEINPLPKKMIQYDYISH